MTDDALAVFRRLSARWRNLGDGPIQLVGKGFADELDAALAASLVVPQEAPPLKAAYEEGFAAGVSQSRAYAVGNCAFGIEA